MSPKLTTRQIDVTKRGPASRLSEKSREKGRRRRSTKEGSSEKVCQRRFVGEGPSEKGPQEIRKDVTRKRRQVGMRGMAGKVVGKITL